MPDSVIEAPPKLPFQAESREEYKRIRAGEKVPATVQPPDEDEEIVDPDEQHSASAAASEPAGKTSTQEKPGEKPAEPAQPEKRDKSLDGRIKQLRSQGKHAEANKLMVDAAVRTEREQREKLEKELQDLRTRKPEERSTPVETKPQPVHVSAADDPEPKQADFDGSAGKTYEDYLIAKARHGARQELREAHAKEQQTQVATRVNAKLKAVRAKHADFDQVTAGDLKTGSGFIMTPAMQQFFVEHDLGAEVTYKVAATAGERDRIAALHPVLQIAELSAIARELAAPPAAANPEKPVKPPASKIGAPPPRAGGAEAPALKDPSQATSRAEYRKIREQQRKKGR
jgi:hypothetical protein